MEGGREGRRLRKKGIEGGRKEGRNEDRGKVNGEMGIKSGLFCFVCSGNEEDTVCRIQCRALQDTAV